MAVVREICPSCSAPIDVPSNVSRLKCPYCSTPLVITREDGTVALAQAQQVTDAIQAGNLVTQAELRGLQINQEISVAEMRLANIQSEIRLIERAPQDRVARAQLKDLRTEEATLQRHLAELQAELNPTPGGTTIKESVTHPSAYRPPAQGWRYWIWLLFSLSGRLSRGRFWLGTVLALVLIGLTGLPAGKTDANLSPGASLAVLVFLWISLAVAVKRYHDRNKSGWWVLIGLIPLIGPFWQLIELGFLPGTPSANRYG